MLQFRFCFLILLLTALSCSSSKPATHVNRTGENQESAIIVNSIEEEHHWINDHYPNARVLTQEVIKQSGKSFDVITIRTEEEQRKTFYFSLKP